MSLLHSLTSHARDHTDDDSDRILQHKHTQHSQSPEKPHDALVQGRPRPRRRKRDVLKCLLGAHHHLTSTTAKTTTTKSEAIVIARVRVTPPVWIPNGYRSPDHKGVVVGGKRVPFTIYKHRVLRSRRTDLPAIGEE